MNKNTSDQILKMFLGTIENMRHPFTQDLKIGTYTCATDAVSIILIPVEKTRRFFHMLTSPDPPNINNILPEFKDEIKLDFNLLIEKYNNVPIVEKFIIEKCDSCDGEGEFKHYGDTYECKKCDEKGEIQTLTKEKIKDPNTAFNFDGLNVNIKYISRLIEVFNKASVQKASIVSISQMTIWFKLDELYIGIAGMSIGEEDEDKYTVINILTPEIFKLYIP